MADTHFPRCIAIPTIIRHWSLLIVLFISVPVIHNEDTNNNNNNNNDTGISLTSTNDENTITVADWRLK